MYQVEIQYTTGSTFHTEERTKTFGLWNHDVVVENINRINAHYKAYCDINSYASCMMGKKENTLLTIIKSEPWYYLSEHYFDSWNYNIKLLQNDGSDKIYDTFWIGYFNSLNSCDIVALEE